jgi:hypothetical protein
LQKNDLRNAVKKEIWKAAVYECWIGGRNPEMKGILTYYRF